MQITLGPLSNPFYIHPPKGMPAQKNGIFWMV